MSFAPATNWPSRSASSATIRTSTPTGPIEPGSAPKVVRISSAVAGRKSDRSAFCIFSWCRRSSPRTRPSTTLPSAVTTGMALAVAASSTPSDPASASMVVTSGVATCSGASSGSGKPGVRGIDRATSRFAA